MGIEMTLRTATREEVEWHVEDARRWTQWRLDVEAFVTVELERRKALRFGWFHAWRFRRLCRRCRSRRMPIPGAPSREEVPYPHDALKEPQELELYKSWDMLEELCRGGDAEPEGPPTPASYLTSGGRYGPQNIGGCIRGAFLPDDVREWADWLDAQDVGELTRRARRHGGFAAREDEVVELFGMLREFVRGASQRGEGILVTGA